MRSMLTKSFALLIGLTVAGLAAAGPAAAAPAPQPSGPVPTKTVTQTNKVLVASMRIDTPYGSNEACGRASASYMISGPWTEYKCSGYDYTWYLRLYEYRTETVQVQVPMTWQVVAQGWGGSFSSLSSCESSGRLAITQPATTWNGYTCGSVYVNTWGLYLLRSAWA
ncbi:hypothetical protein [Antribacter gilvus]|uniref:hypothetical protein n=1 Tax=Antribacter gilvus TaxID=2304675 RepID=UPI000F76F5C0|nr:hypothetical protein [Antribacter gilvus]